MAFKLGKLSKLCDLTLPDSADSSDFESLEENIPDNVPVKQCTGEKLL